MKTFKLQFPSLEDKVIVEAAHIYTYEKPGLDHFKSAQIGARMCDYFRNLGAQVTPLLFVDDYNTRFEQKDEVLDVEKYVKQITKAGFEPQRIVYEKDLVPQAQEYLEQLIQEGYAKQHPNGSMILVKGNVKLYDPTIERYSCSLLDASLYAQKLSEAAACVTILPKEYEKQQDATKLILKKLGFDTGGIHMVYYHTATRHLSVESQHVFVESQEQQEVHHKIAVALQVFDLVAQLGGTVIPTFTSREVLP
ncbi:hypothetical protein HYV86_00710 [Candidatus Woesearchaeota archaeon]|nr:hypothetical protein [Candidatus Woesearchaeota archaeon]